MPLQHSPPSETGCAAAQVDIYSLGVMLWVRLHRFVFLYFALKRNISAGSPAPCNAVEQLTAELPKRAAMLLLGHLNIQWWQVIASA